MIVPYIGIEKIYEVKPLACFIGVRNMCFNPIQRYAEPFGGFLEGCHICGTTCAYVVMQLLL